MRDAGDDALTDSIASRLLQSPANSGRCKSQFPYMGQTDRTNEVAVGGKLENMREARHAGRAS